MGSGTAMRGRKFRPLLQTRRLLKFQSPPTPLSAAGTAAHEGRRVMKCGETMWLGEYELHMDQRPTHRREGTNKSHCCQNKCNVSTDNGAFRAAGVWRCLVS